MQSLLQNIKKNITIVKRAKFYTWYRKSAVLGPASPNMYNEEGLLGLITTFVSAFLPSVSTFNAIKSNNNEELEFVSRYWVVFGVWNSLEFVANLLRLIGLIPAYTWLKLSVFTWIYFFGHDFFFHLFSPVVDESEPIGEKILGYVSNGLPMIGDGISFVATRVLAALIRWHQERNTVTKDASLRAQPSERSLSAIPRLGGTNRLPVKSVSLSPFGFAAKPILPKRGYKSSEDLSVRSIAFRRSRLHSLGVDRPLPSVSVTSTIRL